MNILQIISSYGFFGAENVVLELARELGSRGITNFVGIFENSLNPHTELADHARESNLEPVIFKCNGRIDLKTLQEIRRFVKEHGVDIIHTHGYKSDIYGFIVARWLRGRIVSTCHNWIASDLKTNLYYNIDKRILPHLNKVVAVSRSVEAELLRNNVKKDRVALIPNGINTIRFRGPGGDLREKLKICPTAKVVGTVARFTEEKGLFNLLKAAKGVLDRNKDVVFVLVGDGPLRDELEKKVKELGIEGKVIFAGMRSDIPEVYSTLDIFVLPSLNEALPMVLLEAMAAGKPIISTSVGAIPGVINNMKEGVLVRPGEVDELKEAMVLMLGDAGLSDELAVNARKKVVSEFSSRAMCAKYVHLYEGCINAR